MGLRVLLVLMVIRVCCCVNTTASSSETVQMAASSSEAPPQQVSTSTAVIVATVTSSSPVNVVITSAIKPAVSASSSSAPPATSVAPNPPAAKSVPYQVVFRVVKTWTADYANNQSNAYKALKKDVEAGIGNALKGTSYENCTVKKFMNGSIITVVGVTFKPNTNTSTATKDFKLLETAIDNGTLGSVSTVAKSMAFQKTVDGTWGAWVKGTCSCSSKTQTNTRSCTSPQGGGSPCSGASKETVSCTPSGCSAGNKLSPGPYIFVAIIVALMLI